MEYLFLALAFASGGIAGWFIARARYAAGTAALEQSLSQSKALEESLRAEMARARNILEAERLERARLETRLTETQASLAEQKTILEGASRQLTETFKALSLDALNQNNAAFIQLADKTMQAVLSEMKGDFEKRQARWRQW